MPLLPCEALRYAYYDAMRRFDAMPRSRLAGLRRYGARERAMMPIARQICYALIRLMLPLLLRHATPRALRAPMPFDIYRRCHAALPSLLIISRVADFLHVIEIRETY